VYALKSNHFEKVKGVNKEVIEKEINFSILSSLLKENSNLRINQEKWLRSYENGTIQIRDQVYTLAQTDNKRELVFKDGRAIGTKAFRINL
jgi:hypothetical protein